MQTGIALKLRGSVIGMVIILVLIALLAGCGSTPTPTPLPTDTLMPPTNTPTSVPPMATAEPMSAPVAEEFRPLDATVCTQLAEDMGKVLGSKPQTSDADFVDYIGSKNGTGCQALAQGTGADFGDFPDVAAKLQKMLEDQGWKQDIQYQADGPTGTAMGFQKAQGLCLLSVNWEPAKDANCPEDQPISACNLKPEQKEFSIVLNCAQLASQ